jgi:hypothetical protein
MQGLETWVPAGGTEAGTGSDFCAQEVHKTPMNNHPETEKEFFIRLRIVPGVRFQIGKLNPVAKIQFFEIRSTSPRRAAKC